MRRTVISTEEDKTQQAAFLERLVRVAEKHLNMSRNDWGFKHAMARVLHTEDSTVQRWFKGSYPEATFFHTLYHVFRVTPNTLLGIEPVEEDVKTHDLAGLFPQAPGTETVNIPYLNDEAHETITVSENVVSGRTNVVALKIKSGMLPDSESNTAIVDRIDRDPTNPGLFGLKQDDHFTIGEVASVGSTFISVPINQSNTKRFDIIDKTQIVGRVLTILSKMRTHALSILL
jgi:hypothetical protein